MRNNAKKWIRRTGQFFCILVFTCSAAILFFLECADGGNMDCYKKNFADDAASREWVENPVDWDKLKDTDAYAWINVPGTLVDYPVVSAPAEKEDDFYLHHNLKGRYDFAGAIYSRRANQKDFSDPVTVLYGHNMRNGSMFGTLKRFEDKIFFDQHETVYIYMPGKQYTYQIVSASRGDNRDLLGLYDYRKSGGMKAYQEKILMPSDGLVRPGMEFPADCRFLVLSTCTTGSTQRRLVQAVLQKTEETK